LDQSELHEGVIWNMNYFNDMQQEIRVGLEGKLEGFKIRMSSLNIAVGLPVAIFNGIGPHPLSATPAWTGTAYVTQKSTWEWVFVDCSAANLPYSVFDTFTIRIGDGVNYSPGVSLTGNSGWPNPFYDPPFFESQVARNTDRLTFETYMLPLSLTLTATGSCGGVMTLDVEHGTGSYWIVYGDAGSSTVRGVDLMIANPAIAATMGPSLTTIVPASVCGKTVQVVDRTDYAVSNPVVL